MQDTDAKTAIRIDVRMPYRTLEAEVGRRIRVVLREGHDGFEIAAVVLRVGVEHDECHGPGKDIVVNEGNVSPRLFGKSLELVHEDFVGHRECLLGLRRAVDEREQGR